MRSLGDSLSCCGVDNLKGFNVNKANLNHYLYDRENYKFSEAMNIKGTGICFKAIYQKAGSHAALKQSSYAELMQACEKDKER